MGNSTAPPARRLPETSDPWRGGAYERRLGVLAPLSAPRSGGGIGSASASLDLSPYLDSAHRRPEDTDPGWQGFYRQLDRVVEVVFLHDPDPEGNPLKLGGPGKKGGKSQVPAFVDPRTEDQIAAAMGGIEGPCVAEAEWSRSDRAEERRQNAIRRAKRVIRWKCLAVAVDRLLTLTGRNLVLSLEDSYRYLAIFERNVRRRWPRRVFEFVAVPEQHSKGDWHIHLGIRGTGTLTPCVFAGTGRSPGAGFCRR